MGHLCHWATSLAPSKWHPQGSMWPRSGEHWKHNPLMRESDTKPFQNRLCLSSPTTGFIPIMVFWLKGWSGENTSLLNLEQFSFWINLLIEKCLGRGKEKKMFWNRQSILRLWFLNNKLIFYFKRIFLVWKMYGIEKGVYSREYER